MIRTALRPKWLALLGLVIVIVVLFGWLGLWQLNVARHKGQAEALEKVRHAPQLPLNDVLHPQTGLTADHVGRAVTTTGRYEPARQVLVIDRRLGDRLGAWVLTSFVVDGTGARLAVVRGFVDAGRPAPPPPSGTVTLHGTLQPPEESQDAVSATDTDRMRSVDLARLVNRWGGDMYGAWLLVGAEEPPPTGATAVSIVPPPTTDVGGINWRNAAYAVQWWIFAAFVVYVWWRMVRDDHELRTTLSGATAATPPADETVAGTVTGDAGADPDHPHDPTSRSDRPVPPTRGVSR